MGGLIISLIIVLVGWFMIANAAFAERAQMGFWVLIFGVIMTIAAFLEMLG